MVEKIKNISASHIEHIRGNYRVGDDVYNFVTNYPSSRKKIQFEPLAASDSLFNDYPRPHFLDRLFDIVKTEQLLLLGGNGRFDKGRLLKYVALQLRSEELEIKECSEFDNFANLREAIRAETKRNIFILYNLTAEAITFRWEDLRSLIREKSHIVLTSTDTTYDSWMFHEDKPNPCWFSVPERDIYSKETLQTHLESRLTNRQLTLPIPSRTVVDRLSTVEQIDIFLDQVLRSEKPDDPAALQAALDVSTRNDFSWLEPWFLSLNKINRQIVIGLTLFDGAYEKQVFAGYERMLNASWRHRNPELHSIDLEDLIPLRAYFKTEGKFISGTLEGQRKRILELAWRSHKHAILSAIPVLLDIIEESNDPDKVNADLFGTSSHRERIREVLGATLSDIGLLSYEDIHHPLLVLASSGDRTIQLVIADALSRWLPGNAEKTYEVLDYWQQGTAAELLSRSGSASKEQKEAKQLLTNIRGAIVLTLCYMAWYDKTNVLNSRVKDMLADFIEYNEGALVERMQFAVEKITSRHPESMNRLLREEILHYVYYVAPASNGLVIAYNNGQAATVRQILEEWIGAVKKMEDHPEDRDRFEHRECLLATIIFTLKNIDYSADEKAFTIADAYAILEDFRTHNHNNYIRKFLLDAIVQLIDEMVHSSESLSIQLIPNVDEKEREYIVQEFRKRYLAQREELKGGDYLISIGDREFSTWSDPVLRPITPLETMLNKWKAGKNTILTQIALQSFVEFQDIEGVEKKAIDGYLGIKQKEEKELEKKKAEFEKKGLPVYEGAIKPGVEAEAFVKVCAPFVESSRLELLRNMYTVALHENLKDEGTDRFIRLLDDKEEGLVKKVTYLYKLFRDGSFKPEDNPVRSNIQSRLFIAMATLTVPSKARARFRAFAPILLTTPNLSFEERGVIFDKIKPQQQTWLRLSFTLARYPLLLLLLVVFIIYLLNKIF